ncbi:aaa ATPase [Apiospora sp. TS-2023a]
MPKAKLAGEPYNPAGSQSPPVEPLPPPVATETDFRSGPLPLPPPGVAEPELCAEQAELVDLICSGRNVFYTRSAGCGKSTVLKAFTKRLKEMGKKVYILAPTGRAALQVNGITTWTYTGWSPEFHKKTLAKLCELAHGKFVYRRFSKTDMIVINEISMVENLHFERINKVMQDALHDPNLPVQKAFGGVQVVMSGDFCQLPPPKPFRHCMEYGSRTIKTDYKGEKSYRCPTTHHPVWRDEQKWEIHRQNDPKFIGILNKCRIGKTLTESDKRLLMDHPTSVHHATKIFPIRKNVAEARDTFKWRITLHPNLSEYAKRKAVRPKGHEPLLKFGEHRFEECVELKKGMLVVLLTNLNLDQGLCNGSQGILCGFKEYHEDKLPTYTGEHADFKESEVKSHIEGAGAEYKVWPVVRFHNGITRVIRSECSINELGDAEPYSLLSRTDIPLMPAWAMTIHKSQGLTIDRVIADLTNAFEAGQSYVALSRATSLEGLRPQPEPEPVGAPTSALGQYYPIASGCAHGSRQKAKNLCHRMSGFSRGSYSLP